jgi:mono/diheme cytochrome c family protein
MNYQIPIIVPFAIAWLLQPLALRATEPKPADLAKLPAAATRAVDYAQDIQPLLAEHCYECHGADAQEAGLRLDRKKSALAGADSGPVFVEGKSARSRLIHLVAGLDEEVGRMPPEDAGDALTTEQIGLLRAWIDQGLPWPDDGKGDANTAAAKLWSLQPIVRPGIPKTNNTVWVRNPIDAFILSKLEKENVSPSPEADRLTLIRRVYLDLLGLPPSEAEMQTYENNQQPDAFEQMVDRALQSPHYGERWGRYWLDLARYADTDGFEEDRGRPFAWRYRDWVIDALNRDVPFDAFTVQQLAGDLLVPTDAEFDKSARIATGFHRNTMLNLEGGADREEDRVKRTIDRTNTMGTVWLGLTVGCANCHTHKYDPITQREYFQLYAFYNNLDEVDIAVNQAEGGDQAPDLTPRQQMMDIEDDKGEAEAKPTPKTKKKKAPKVEAEVARRMAGTMTLAQAVRELDKPRATHVHLRGDFLSPGPEVQANTLEVLPPLSARGEHPDRLDLARWLVDKKNPLTARVTANRIWQNHFGRGLVFTSDDFGTQGEPPSHPELLDWLAAELQDGDWRLKRLHRLIVTSATYRQSAVARPELVDRDPYNTWLARQNRIRMEAEIVRDLALSASGQLDRTVGGPSVRPPQPFGLFDVAYAGPTGFAKWEASKGPDRYRRGMYIWFQRISPYPSLMAFDSPEMNLTCSRRERSNTPLQSLTLLNDVVFVECAQALGRRMVTEVRPKREHGAADKRIEFAFRACLGRPPTDAEHAVLRQLYARMLDRYQGEPAAAVKLIGESLPENVDASQLAACVAVARALVNLDEFITRE